MKCIRHIALIAFCLVSAFAARAQGGSVSDTLKLRFNLFSVLCSPEKVYLHYDRSCYTAGESIWFKGWVQEASRLSSLPPSNFLYAEVLDERGDAVVRVKIKRSGNGFPGCLELPDNLKTGYYTLRAYTLWQLNGDQGYLFNDRIRIIGSAEKKERSPEPHPGEVEISFWPEGGRYFSQHESTVGFKAVDRMGRSVDFSGVLVDDAGEEVCPVITRHDGMGAFTFLPQSGKKYSVRDAAGKLHPLPAPSENGATLRLRGHSGMYYIGALGVGGGLASLLVRDASELRPLGEVSLDGLQEEVLMVEGSSFHPGINHLLLVDAHGRILAERLFFIRDGMAPVCQLDMSCFEPTPRALTRGEISLLNPDGTPLDGTCSISVVRGVLKDWQQSDGITSYMGLSSELKGCINQPYYYFDPEIPEKERDAALDLLMMIQGWRYYDLERITDTKAARFQLRYERERMQEIRGHISRRMSSRMPKKFTFTFTMPKKDLLQSMAVDQGRYFIIDSLDFEENTEVLISIGTSRLGATYLPRWNGDPLAESRRYPPAPGFAAGGMRAAPLLSEMIAGDTLQAAVVTASYDDDDVLTFGRSHRRDLETYKDLTLVEYLSLTKARFEYDGEYMYNRGRRGSRPGGGDDNPDSFDYEDDENESARVKLIVDDEEQAWWSYDMFRLENIRSLNISMQPDPIYGGEGGVVHITLKPGVSRPGLSRDPSLLYFVPLGYQVPRYFESPRYDRGEAGSYDHRNTVWWSPEVILDGGVGSFEFCNTDQMDYPYIIRIEGLSSDGRPFSRHCIVSP